MEICCLARDVERCTRYVKWEKNRSQGSIIYYVTPLGKPPIHSFFWKIFSTGLLCVGTLLAVGDADVILPASWNFLHSGEDRYLIIKYKYIVTSFDQSLKKKKKKRYLGQQECAETSGDGKSLKGCTPTCERGS